jgi:hypothetical protein
VLIRRLRAVRERVMLPDTGDALTPRLTRASSSW